MMLSADILLSVIIPYYKGAAFIEDLIESIEGLNPDIIHQMEVLIVDDGSPVSSQFNLDRCFKEKAFVSVFHKEHRGIADTRNYGLKKSRGQFITFCDQDDLCLVGYSRFIRLIENNIADLLMANYPTKTQEGNSHSNSLLSNDAILCGSLCKEMVRRHLGGGTTNEIPEFYPTIWNCIFRKLFLDQNEITFSRFVDYEDDWLFILDSLLAANRVMLTSQYWYQHCERNDSESHVRKYIPDYYKKRKALRHYLESVSTEASLTSQEQKNSLSFFDAQTVIGGFYNCAPCPFPLYSKEMSSFSFSIVDYFRLRSYFRPKKLRLLAIALCSRFWIVTRSVFLIKSKRHY